MIKTTGTALTALIGVLAVGATAVPVTAEAALYKSDTLKITADFRLRYENDWDSQKSSGADRLDRERIRIRARLGLNYKFNDTFSFGARLRTGANDSQQSPHWTIFDLDSEDYEEGAKDINLDKYYIKGKFGNTSAWVGRNGFSFWKQNELFWDDDATVLGASGSHKFDLGSDSLTANLGIFKTPAGMDEFSGTLAGAQLVYKFNKNLTFAGGYFDIDGDGGDSDADIFIRGNGSRDYEIWVGNVQWSTALSGIPVSLGADIYRNEEDYKSSDINDDETDGYVLQAALGKVKKQGDWQAAIYYADLEKYAVNSSFSQDDWMRWGSATQTRSSGFDGFEYRLVYGLLDNLKIVARYYDVEANEKVATGSNKEDGKRFRVDFNYKF